MSNENAEIVESLIIFFIIFILAFIADRTSKKILVSSIKNYVKRSKATWDDIFMQKKVFNRLAHIAPALVVYYTIDFALDPAGIVNFIKTITVLYTIIISLLVADSFISALHEIYLTFPIASEKPVKGYVQVVKIFLYFLTFILIISILSKTPVLKLLAGLGALAAVLLLVFKDTILGLVASIQVSANNMVKPGDWITMPSRGADGTVLEISLNTVKVQNWDKTISTFPTYALVTESFNNWKGMEESGGRRIKRSLNIDMKSVRFLDEDLKTRLKRIQLIQPYIAEREKEIEKFNAEKKVDATMPVNGRRMTNLGVFRKYLEAYLHQHPKIQQEMTFLIRHLQPAETGIPIEIYVFSKEQEWARYESLQSDIFDHVLASLEFFELRVFQSPSGSDFQMLLENQAQ
ncbi:MAG: mechanosensitive ion channel family protein [Bacteroidales bacterium]|nr:mechanosensitive ion channel family protein [Bacteroidales bacterium]